VINEPDIEQYGHVTDEIKRHSKMKNIGGSRQFSDVSIKASRNTRPWSGWLTRSGLHAVRRRPGSRVSECS
jgi:hypothetical protein